MKKTIIIVLAMICLIPDALAGSRFKPGQDVTMSKSVLMDKIRGAWAGQIIGCTYGGPTEFRYATTIDDNIDIPWNEHIIKDCYDHSPGLYDDVYMDLTFVDVFAREGLDAPIESFAKAFAYAGYPLWHANAQARYNIIQGIMPPESGHWLNNPHADDIDFQIEADYAGIMAPGMPNAATHYSDGIGHIMNYGDGWYGGVYVAAMYSLAYVSNDVEFIVSEALKTIPSGSRYHKCMADVIRWYHQYPKDWKLTWMKVNDAYGFDVGCPDGVYNAFDIDAVLNSAYIIIGLLYGDKNFYRTIDISCRCGADSDCNPASSGGILGAIIGYDAIPDYWKKPLQEVADRNFKYTEISFNKASELSLDQALQVVRLNGGEVSGDKVRIRTQKPQAVRFEQAFEGHWPVAVKNVMKTLGTLDKFSFTGNGVVLKHEIIKTSSFSANDYLAEVEAYVDGNKAGVVRLPMTGNGRCLEIFHAYNLPVGKHEVSFKWLNKRPDVDIRIRSAVIYSDKSQKTIHPDK